MMVHVEKSGLREVVFLVTNCTYNREFMAFHSFMGYMMHQMDVKKTLFNMIIEEEGIYRNLRALR